MPDAHGFKIQKYFNFGEKFDQILLIYMLGGFFMGRFFSFSFPPTPSYFFSFSFLLYFSSLRERKKEIWRDWKEKKEENDSKRGKKEIRNKKED